jgi:uncharacterized protein
MSRLSKLLVVPALALALAVGVALGAVLQPVGGSTALAGPDPAPSGGPPAPPVQATSGSPSTVAVGGEGRVAVKPDVAYAVFGVDTTNANMGQALAENSKRMTAVLDKLKARGLQDRDLQTVGFNVSPQYTSSGGIPSGYRVSNGVRAAVRDLSVLGAIIEEAVAAGATTVRGVSFDLADKEAAVRLAREAAVKDTRDKAEQYARHAGVQLGAPVSLVESSAPARPAVGAPTPASVPRTGDGGGPPPLQAGEGFVVVTVQAVYEIR